MAHGCALHLQIMLVVKHKIISPQADLQKLQDLCVWLEFIWIPVENVFDRFQTEVSGDVRI